MARGKYERVVKHGHKKKKAVSFLLSIVLILTLAVGGTLAYVMATPKTVQNQFAPAYVTSRVNVEGDTIDVTNTGNISAYIRAAIIVNWVDEAGNILPVVPTTDQYALGINTEKWTPEDEFYYYKSPVASYGTTDDLVTSITVKMDLPEGYGLNVQVVAEAIQADGMGAASAVNAWAIALSGS